MSAKAQMKDMLDQLMGTQRDGVDPNSINFRDDEVCKTFLLGSCPHEILSGTRADIGNCRKTHDLALKADYEMACKAKNFYYEFDAFDHLTRFVSDTDMKIEVSKKKLAEQQAEISAELKSKEESVQQLNLKIAELLETAEMLGSVSEVDKAKEVLEQVEKVREEKSKAEDIYRNSMPSSTYQQQKLRVCDVCSAYLGLHDNDARLADHFTGKLHLGFIEIREKQENLKKKVEGLRGNLDAVKQRRTGEAEDSKKRRDARMRPENSDQRRSRSPDRRRRRSKERHRGHSSGSRPRDRRHHHHRSRSRSRDRSYRS